MSWTWTGAGLETKLGWNCWNSWPSCSKQRSRHIEAISSHSDEWRHGIYIQKISVSSYIYDNYSHYSDETFFLYRLFFFGIDTKMSLKKNMSRLLSTANNQPRGAERRFSPPEPLEPGIPQLPPSPVSPDLKERHGKGWGSVFRSFGKHQLVIALSFCKHQLIIALEYLL